jgi:hypothetical protein
MEEARAGHEITERIEELIRQTDSISNPQARELAVELVSAVMELHGAALSRVVEIARTTPPGQSAIDAMAADEFVSAVLALHDVHPLGFEERLNRAMEKLRGELKPGDMDIELMEVTPERVTVRLVGGTPARRAAARHWIESAVYEAAPEAEQVSIAGTEEKPGFVPIESLLVTRGVA